MVTNLETPGAESAQSPARGAYGLRLAGLESASHYLNAAPAGWPSLAVERVIGAPAVEAVPDAPVSVQQLIMADDWAEYRRLDRTGQAGGVRMNREPLVAMFTSPSGLDDHAMIHPELGLLAGVANRWLGRDVFHAGAFLTDTGAWAVMGAKEAGKSSLLGLLAAKGVGIVTDDVLVVEDGVALAGPRCIDLRKGAADWLGQGDDIGVVGLRQRWRMHVRDVAAALPLRGWIVPAWGDRIELETIPVTSRLPLLYANLALTCVPRHPQNLLPLLALPFVTFRRPRRWDIAEEATTVLLDRLAG